MYRLRQPMTVGRVVPVLSTISFVPTPSAASNTIRARRAKPAGTEVDRTHDSKTLRSDSDTTGTGLRRIPHSLDNLAKGIVNTLTKH